MTCIGAQYAMLRAALSDVHSAAKILSDDLNRNIEQALTMTGTISEGHLMDAQDTPQCAVVWGGAGFASGVYIGGGSVVTAAHLSAAFSPTYVSLGIADASQRTAHPLPVLCAVPAPDPFIYDVMVLKINPATLKGMAPIQLVTTAEFAEWSAAGSDVTIMGFGCGWPAGHPKLATMGIKTDAVVQIIPGAAAGMPSYDPNLQFVVADTSAGAAYRAVCTSDSGGPVLATIGGTQKLIGIVHASGSGVAATPGGCGVSRFSVAMRVDVRSAWITSAAC